MTGHDYLLKWIKETYPLMDSADYAELDYYDMQKFAVWLVKLLTIPHVIKSVCDDCTAYPFDERGKTPLCKTCKDNPSQTVL